MKDYRESSLSHDQLVADLNQQLTVLQNANKRLEDDLTSAHQRASLDLDEKTSHMHQELQVEGREGGKDRPKSSDFYQFLRI